MNRPNYSFSLSIQFRADPCVTWMRVPRHHAHMCNNGSYGLPWSLVHHWQQCGRITHCDLENYDIIIAAKESYTTLNNRNSFLFSTTLSLKATEDSTTTSPFHCRSCFADSSKYSLSRDTCCFLFFSSSLFGFLLDTAPRPGPCEAFPAWILLRGIR